jgi:diguanylate cyclase (GGDEF)-like protein
MPKPPPNPTSSADAFRVWRRPLRSLPTRLGFFVLAATLCTSLVTSTVSLRAIDSFLREKIQESFPAMLQRTGIELDFWYEDHKAIAAEFARDLISVGHLQDLLTDTSPSEKSFARTVVGRQLHSMLLEVPTFSTAFVRDGQGELLLWRGDELEMSQSMRDQLASATFSRVGYSEGRYYQITSTQLEGTLGATLHFVFDLAVLAPVLRLHGGGMQGHISIVDAEQRYIASSSDERTTSTYALPLPENGAATRAVERIDDKDRRFIASSMPVGRHNWSLVIEEEYDLAFARVATAMRRVAGINLAIIAVFALIAYRFAVGLVRPVEALSRAARQISNGEINIQLPRTASRDEVGLLTRAFSEMTSRIEANAREIEAANRHVEEVNAELRTRNDELHSANHVLAQLSITDGLTGLYNHRYFQDSLAKEAKRTKRTEEPLALILIDIDHFKSWNDSLGHAAGDAILKRIAEVMKTLLRSSDVLARYGGEEFALLAPETSADGAEQLAEKIRRTIAETQFFINPPSEQRNVTVSMGLSHYAGDKKQLFSEADQALYRAKDSGRDCVMVFEPNEGS